MARHIAGRATTLLFMVLAGGGMASFAITALLVKERVTAGLQHEARFAAQRVELEIGNVYEHLVAMSQNPLVSNGLTDTASGRRAYLGPFLQNDMLARQGATLALLDFAGVPVSVAQADVDAVEVPPSTVAGVLRSGEPWAEIVRRKGRGGYQLQIIAPVRYPASGQAEGVLLLLTDLEKLAILTPTDNAQRMRFHVQLLDAGGVLVGGEPRSTLFNIQYPVRLGGPFKDRRLALEVGVETGSILRLLGTWLAVYAVVGVLALLAVLLAVRRMARTLTAPLAHLNAQVDGIRHSGRLDFVWDYPANDEIGRLGQSFHSMVERVAQIQGELEYRVDTRTRELRQSKEELAYLLRFAQSTLDGLTAHICVLDADGVIRSVNRAWRDFAAANGAPPDSVGIGTSYLAVCDADSASAVHARKAGEGLRKVLRGDAELFEMEYPCIGQKTHWFQLRASRMADGVGGVVVAHEDITATKSVEAALQDRNDQLDTLLSSSPDGLLSIDGNGVVKFANATFFRMTGIAPASILNQPEACLDAALREMCSEPARFAGLSTLCAAASPCDDAPPRHLLTLSDPSHSVFAIPGVFSRAHSARKIFYFRDVTHEVEVDRMKSDFLATAAHELRTPMASIYGYTELLLSDEFDSEMRRDMLQTIYQQTDRLVNIINELLDLARIEARRGKDFRFGRVTLCAVVDRALAGLAVDRTKWPIEVCVADSVPVVWGDPDKLYQAVLNILSNAVKYSPEGGAISVRILDGDSAHHGQAGIRIRDSGIGMSPVHLSRIFERFFRADTSGKFPGTGLGMAIVKEIVDLHHGHIVVESELGKGMEISIWLPAAVDLPDTPVEKLAIRISGPRPDATVD